MSNVQKSGFHKPTHSLFMIWHVSVTTLCCIWYFPCAAEFRFVIFLYMSNQLKCSVIAVQSCSNRFKHNLCSWVDRFVTENDYMTFCSELLGTHHSSLIFCYLRLHWNNNTFISNHFSTCMSFFYANQHHMFMIWLLWRNLHMLQKRS